ncbi:MAG TPA: alpha/beta fold hydrolase, partial [Rhizomicrobium sp.]|nr:alpha/beta fold hydrolase [Rhizomicrobium sp.]
MTLKNLSLGLLLAAALIAPSLAHADTIVTRERFSDEIVGAGPDLVFIPGLASSRATWKATADRLRGHYRLHLIQLAGFAGEAPRANAAGAVLVPTAEAIDAYLVEAHLTPATLIGHSLGGTTILYLAQHRG